MDQLFVEISVSFRIAVPTTWLLLFTSIPRRPKSATCALESVSCQEAPGMTFEMI